MTFKDFEEKIKTRANPTMPTNEQIIEEQRWIRQEFPYSVNPSHNPKQGKKIQEWLDSNVGPMDEAWTWLGLEIRFRKKEDYVLYGFTWQKFDEDNGSAWIPVLP